MGSNEKVEVPGHNLWSLLTDANVEKVLLYTVDAL